MIYDINGNVIDGSARKIDDHTSPTLVEDFYIDYTDGSAVASEGASYAVYDVIPGESIVYLHTVGTPDDKGLAFFSEYGEFVGGEYARTVSQTITVPDKAATVRATVDSVDQIVQLTAQTLINIGQKTMNPITQANPLDYVSPDPGFAASFVEIFCIGDGLTYGSLDSDDGFFRNEMLAYPSILSLHGVWARNLGIPDNAYTSDICNELENNLNFDSTFLDDGKAFILAVGAMDITKIGDIAYQFTGDVSTDIDLSDYTQNADTSVGWYARMIQVILTYQPKAKIFCCCIPNTIENDSPGGDYRRAEANEKIRDIVELFPGSCYLMDFETYGVQPEDVDSWKSIYYTGLYPNALGYNMFARQVLSYMNWIINNNLEDFKGIGFIGTNYDYGDQGGGGGGDEPGVAQDS